ncbi:ferredoxin reductase [Rugosimonospora africana]|uniref:Oxidoreductase n=1 Tax=Rugosimonospora africana TaxID=556532 RepID=A0A8J3R227_9ACTN|nr:ferredoxin reductase [Rugosimonospora africana]GIH20102.1 oxidoreductase [Rugosimonospora africana]
MAQRRRWLPARVTDIHTETPTTRSVVFEAPGWGGHLAGQHVDVKLIAEDGYSAERSYSMAAPEDGDRVALTVQRVRDGEVSPYLVDEMMPGDEVELRGPIGGWFVWRPEEPGPVLLVAGGSGVVPLMAMVRERARVGSAVPFRLVYSVRSADDAFYGEELSRLTGEGNGDGDGNGLGVTLLYTRSAPPGTTRPVGRITADDLSDAGWPPDAGSRAYVCGPTAFVEAVAGLLQQLGHDPSTIRTERFGPTGG